MFDPKFSLETRKIWTIEVWRACVYSPWKLQKFIKCEYLLQFEEESLFTTFLNIECYKKLISTTIDLKGKTIWIGSTI